MRDVVTNTMLFYLVTLLDSLFQCNMLRTPFFTHLTRIWPLLLVFVIYFIYLQQITSIKKVKNLINTRGLKTL